MREVLGVLKAQGASLDLAELDFWAGQCSVADLLARAKRDAGIGSSSG